MAFGEITDLRRPVVHLEVDVKMIIAVPWRVIVLTPFALKVGGETAGTRTTHQEITTKLEIQRHQLRIRRAVAHGFQSLIRGVVHRIGLTEIQLHAAEQLLMISDVSREKLAIGLFSSRQQRLFASLRGVGGNIIRILVTSRAHQQERHFVGVLDFEFTILGADATTADFSLELRLVFESELTPHRETIGGYCLSCRP